MSHPLSYKDKDHRLNVKFSTSFLIVALLVIGIVTLGAWGIRLTFQSSQTLADQQLPSVLRLQTMLGNVTNIHKGIQHVLGNSSPSDVHTTMLSVQSETATLQKIYPAYIAQDRNPQQLQQVQKLQSDIDPWVASLHQLTSLAIADIPQNDRDTQMRAIYKTWQYGTIAISADIQGLIATNINETTANIRQSNDTGNRMIIMIIVVGGIATVLSIVLGVILARMVMKSVSIISTMNEQLRIANARLESLVTTDPLTGLLNHRAIASAFDTEIERAKRYNRTFAILFLDIDHFKSINDTYGHAGGDVVLCVFATTIQSTLRQMDLAGRWGGEEFLVLLPETHEEGAVQVAERMRTSIATHLFPLGGGLHLTCSIGVAIYRNNGHEREALLIAADQAMYAAKHLGRNQVRSASEDAVKTLTDENQESREETALRGIADALCTMISVRDHYTGNRAHSIERLSIEVALAMKCSHEEALVIGLAGRLHDIGKVAMPDAILCKKGPLTEEEWAVMRMHPIVGAEILSYIPSLSPIAPLIRSHHERWNGGGYPDNLSGEMIPLGARIIAVVDSYDAITTNRSHQTARSPSWALTELQRCAGTQFDPHVVDIFQQILANDQAAA